MSRGEFRGQVDAPRPLAAWVMAVVASATLWATEQIPVWIVAVQLIGFAVALLTRRQPPAALRSAVLLNIGMLGITSVTIRAALAGHPATVSLAYFTALAQVLQLLDARPRRSEFVLVTVALFQVILASNLTDSVFFPPLVLAFVVSVTWTLLIHTLQMEAAEAGDPQAAEHVVSSDLRRMTALATSGCILLALVLFLMLPRVKNHALSGRLPTGLAVSGFSSTVQLGSVGQIRKDHSVVLRVESLSGPLPNPASAYWRGLAFDVFDGRSWSISGPNRPGERRPVNGIGRFGIELTDTSGEPESADAARDAQRIIREPTESGVVFSPGEAVRIEGPFQHLEKDLNGGLYLPRKDNERVRYTVWTRPSARNAAALHEDRARMPFEAAAGGPQPARRYLELPPLQAPVAPIAERLVGEAATDFERAWRLQEGLRQEGRYSDSPPPLGDGDRSPIEDFLHGDLEGHCEYFASAMVLLARSQGLPARLVNGYAGGVLNPVGGFIEVSQADAHAWVEIHFEEAGWVRFDPTPPDRRLRLADQASLWMRAQQLGSAIELWWFQRVVDFDSADQIGGLRSLWNAWNGPPSDQAADVQRPAPGQDGRAPIGWRAQFEKLVRFGLPLAALLASVAVGWAAYRRRRPSSAELPAAYAAALSMLRRRGWQREAARSARDFADDFAAAAPAPAADAFSRITESYLEERFGDGDAATGRAADLQDELACLERAVDGMGLRDQPNVAESRLGAGEPAEQR